MGSLPQLSIVKGPQRELSPKALHKIFESKIDFYKNKIALSYLQGVNESTIDTTYEEINELSNRIARLILSKVQSRQLQANRDGDWIVAVCMPPSDKLIVVLLAIWKAGAAYLPIDPSFPANRVQHIRKEAQPFLVIHDDSVDSDQFQNVVSLNLTKCWEEQLNFTKDNILDNETLTNAENCLAIVLYTSGSTGVPKGVRLPHAVILNRLQWQWNCFPYSPTETTGCFKTALTFVDSVSEIWGPLLNGMRLLIIPKNITKDPAQLIKVLDKFEIERLVLVPTLLRAILLYLSVSEKHNALQKLKIWVCSGEPLAISLAIEFFDYFEERKHFLYNFYGSTEVMGDVTYFACESRKQLENFSRVPIGYPVDNTRIYLLDSELRPVQSGVIGELYVSGLNLADGYVNGRDPHRFLNNTLSADASYSKLYRTGDFGSIQKGAIMFEGRVDSQIKIRGHRVDLSEVEMVVSSLEMIDKVVVLCYNAGEIDQALLAFVTLRSDFGSCSGKNIEAMLKNKLTDYMIPHAIIIDKVPLLVNGKVDRQYLLKYYAESLNNNNQPVLEIDYTGVPEHLMQVAEDMFQVVSEAIGKLIRAKLSIFSNFYELGGNSLNSIYTVTQLRQKGYFISIAEFITAKDLGEVLQKLSETEISLKEDNYGTYLRMTSHPLTLADLQITIDIITSSFYGKADLEQWLKDDILPSDYEEIIREIWETLVRKGLSFLVRDENERPLGVSLNFDARDEPEVTVTSKLQVIFDFLEHLEGPIRDNKLPLGQNQILHSFMMGTIEELSAQENVAVINFMEDEVVSLAKRKNFAGIFTTNTNPLTQQLGTNVYNYECLLDYQVNQYVHSDNTRPFSAAPDTQRAIVHWKDIRAK